MFLLFNAEQALVLMQLVLAHLLTDFFLQPYAWVLDKEKRKERSPSLYYHVGLTALVAGIFTGSVIAALLILVTHYAIDLWKLYQTRNKLRNFLLDQLFHLFVLLLVWLYLIEGYAYAQSVLASFGKDFRVWAILTTYLFCTFPMGLIIGMATGRWRKEIVSSRSSLDEAGKWIGILERLLILTFLLFNQFEAIGFLIAAKALLRFRDDDLKLTEYVLIGTLLSFSMTIAVGLALKSVL